jgi:hypothetical protein
MRACDALWKVAVRLLSRAMVAVALVSLAVPAAAQDKVWRVGLLSNGTRVPTAGQQSGWRDGVLLGLDQNGYRPGLNLELVERYSDGHADRLPGLAREIAAASVDVVVAISAPMILSTARAQAMPWPGCSSSDTKMNSGVRKAT